VVLNNKKMKTMLYLASGPYLKGYDTLAYDKVYFVEKNDKAFGPTFQHIAPNTEWICKDVLQSIDILKARGEKIDCLVSLNEGLESGGGAYPILSDEVMGYISPLLNDEFLLICDFMHYGLNVRSRYASLDWGFEKIKELKEGDSGFIDPKFFTESQIHNSGSYGHVYKMKRIKGRFRLSTPHQKVKVSVIHGSIWDDESNLDALGIVLGAQKVYGDAGYNSQSISDFFRTKPKVFNLKDLSFEDVLLYCESHTIRHLGLCPWMKGSYGEIKNRLRQPLPPSLESIRFYHLNKNDFTALIE